MQTSKSTLWPLAFLILGIVFVRANEPELRQLNVVRISTSKHHLFAPNYRAYDSPGPRLYPSKKTLHYCSFQVFRHGDRAPETFPQRFPNDPHMYESFFPMGPGGLTNVKKFIHIISASHSITNRPQSSAPQY